MPSFNIDSFRTQLTGDGARPNLFEVQLQFPPFVTLGTTAQVKTTFMCKSAQMPGSTIGVAPVFYKGREVKLAGNRTWQDWTIQIINDEDMVIRNAFEQWAQGLNSPQDNVRNPAAAVIDGGYAIDAVVNHFGKRGNLIKQYKLIGMWPMDISPIELDWGQNDAIEEFTVTLAMQYWIDNSLNGSASVGVSISP
jgi:hypothetical protein